MPTAAPLRRTLCQTSCICSGFVNILRSSRPGKKRSIKTGCPTTESMNQWSLVQRCWSGPVLAIGSPRSILVPGRRSGDFSPTGPSACRRLPHDGKGYFVSDDGYLYCVDVETGQLIWKFRGGPAAHKVLGNGRLISAWPARGGPVLCDGNDLFHG